jgi:alanyl-tRNA synthetase
MTDRLYYTDARVTRFSATIRALEHDGRHVILDRTAFYPTSGGQPHDLGSLGPVPVVDVIDEESRIVHVCADAMPMAVGDMLEGAVDWDRRYDHMQQHTGQHLLSALLHDEFGWPTVSVHFGDEMNTVDVATEQIDASTVEEIERLVNQLAADSSEVSVSFEDAAYAEGLRKASDREGVLRIVTIDGVDRSACGGTHVRNTGEIGAILLRRVERTKGNTRLEFVCGLRAVALARRDALLLAASARQFSAAVSELPALIEAQQRRVGELERDRKRLSTDLARFEAQAAWDRSTTDAEGVKRIILEPIDGPVRTAEPMVQALVGMGRCLVLAVSPATGGVMLGAADGAGVDAGATLRATLTALGGKGGGSPRFAQGSAPGNLKSDAIARALGWNG